MDLLLCIGLPFFGGAAGAWLLVCLVRAVVTYERGPARPSPTNDPQP